MSIESSPNQNTVPMGHQPEDIIERIDLFFKTDAEMSAEDKLKDGLDWAVEHGYMTPEDCTECLRAYKDGYTATLGIIDVETELL